MSRRLMSRSRSGSSSTSRMSPVFIGWIPSISMPAPAATATAAPTAAAPHAIAHQASLHFADRFQLLDNLVGFLLLVADSSLPFGHLRLEHGRESLDRRRTRIGLGDVVEQ